jgi:ABC-type sugar transport system permease subunit
MCYYYDIFHNEFLYKLVNVRELGLRKKLKRSMFWSKDSIAIYSFNLLNVVHTLPLIITLFSTGLTKFRLSELEAATDNFSKKYEVGRGGFGVVYKVLHMP